MDQEFPSRKALEDRISWIKDDDHSKLAPGFGAQGPADQWDRKPRESEPDNISRLLFNTNTGLETSDTNKTGHGYTTLGVRICRTDRLLEESNLVSPIVRVHAVDIETGEYVKRNTASRNVLR